LKAPGNILPSPPPSLYTGAGGRGRLKNRTKFNICGSNA